MRIQKIDLTGGGGNLEEAVQGYCLEKKKQTPEEIFKRLESNCLQK